MVMNGGNQRIQGTSHLLQEVAVVRRREAQGLKDGEECEKDCADLVRVLHPQAPHVLHALPRSQRRRRAGRRRGRMLCGEGALAAVTAPPSASTRPPSTLNCSR